MQPNTINIFTQTIHSYTCMHTCVRAHTHTHMYSCAHRTCMHNYTCVLTHSVPMQFDCAVVTVSAGWNTSVGEGGGGGAGGACMMFTVATSLYTTGSLEVNPNNSTW